MARVTWQDGAAGGTPINADNLNKINLDVTDAETRAKARANHTGTQAISTVTGLQAALDSKANVGSGGGAVDSVAGKTGVVTLTADDMTDGTANKVLTAADKTKLGGIATGATANLADANLLARANHTGTQAISTVTNLQATLDAKVATITAGTGVWVSRAGGVVTVNASPELPPGAVVTIKHNGTSWPARTTATTRTDLVVMWVGNPGGTGPSDAIDGDVWIQG